MTKGLDCPSNTSHAVQAIKDAGYEFMIRYYSHTPAKNLTYAEAKALSAERIYCVSVWESAGNHASYFNSAKGAADATSATAQAFNVGQPNDSPIYYAVDFDASPAEIRDRVIPYFKTINLAAVHPVGAYGSGLVLESLLNAGLITFAWMAMSAGWRGSKTFHRWNIRQVSALHFHGLDCDTNESGGHGGGFLVT